MFSDDNLLRQILLNIEHIGTPHSVCMKLMQKSADDTLDPDEMALMLSQDSTIVALILKTANSVHFSRGQRIKTVRQAVIHLGMANIKKLLFAVEMIGIFKGAGASENFPEKNFWMHTLAGAVLASKYAAFKKTCDPDIAYASALLRDIGVLAIRQFLPGDFERMLSMQAVQEFSFDTLSRTLFGISHREISHRIGVRWNLPNPIVESMRDIVDPLETDNGIRALREAILFADELLHITQYCIWDTWRLLGHFDFHGVPCEEMFNDTKAMVTGMMEEFRA